jgi:hypothetical protein
VQKKRRFVFKTRDRVIVAGQSGIFQFIQLARRNVAVVMPEQSLMSVPLDEDTVEESWETIEVPLASLKPLYLDPTEQQRRAKHAVRMFKQGIRLFRLAAPTGDGFAVLSIDPSGAFACGRRFKRKTVIQVPVADLFPMTVSSWRKAK